MPRHSPCALSSLTYYSSLVLSFFELCRPQRSFFQLNCSVTLPYPFLPEISVPLFASFLAILTPRKYCSSLLPCFFPSFLVQFSRCKLRSKTRIKHSINLSILFQPYRKMVEISGIEPLTPCLQSRCSPS